MNRSVLIQELYDAAKGVQGTGLPIPYAADRVIELIDCLRNAQKERDIEWLDAFAQIDSFVTFAGNVHQYVHAVFESCLRRANDEAALNVQLRSEIEKLTKQTHCRHRRYSWPSKDAAYAFCDDCNAPIWPNGQ